MNIGLVLSGGMAKGAYQIGALKALNEFIPQKEVKYMSCASIGVLNGYAYATNTLSNAEAMWRDFCGNEKRILITKALRSETLQQSIKNLYTEENSLERSFYCSLLDIKNRHVVYKDLSQVQSDKIPLYLKASVAMPVYNRPVKLDNVSYYDGAMIDNIPVFPMMKHKLDYIICIYFDDVSYKFEKTGFDNKVIKIVFPSENMVRQSVVFTNEGIRDMMEKGYERTYSILNSVFRQGYRNIDYIYQTISDINAANKNNNLRITGDMVVTNLNKITQVFLKRKVH